MPTKHTLKIRWGTSRAMDTYGFTLCSLAVDGKRAASCVGNGYDRQGTVLGTWIEDTQVDRLNKLSKEFYGLAWHDPKFDASKAPVPGEEGTVGEREASGVSLGLERVQSVWRDSSKVRTDRHTVPSIDGACGWNSVVAILNAIGGKIEHTAGNDTSPVDEYEVTFS